MSNLDDFLPSSGAPFGGDGSDGAFAPGSNYDFSDAEGSWVIKQYSSITINSGITVSATNRLKGLILFCSGDVTINGEIDLDEKAYGSEEAPPIVYDTYQAADGAWKRAWNEYCATVKGGDGGGSGGKGNGSNRSGGNGAHAGGSGCISTLVNGANASGWSPGFAISSNDGYSQGGSVGKSPMRSSNGTSPGGAGYFGTLNAGGNSGRSPQYPSSSSVLGINATLTTSSAKIGGGFLLIIAKGTLTLGSTANIHCDGGDGFADSVTWTQYGGDGGSGGGVIVLFSQGVQSIDGSATQTVAGGIGGSPGSSVGDGGDGGDGDAGSIVNQQVA